MTREARRLDELCSISIGRTPSRGNAIFWDSIRETQNVWVSIADITKEQSKVISDSKEYLSDKGSDSFSKVKKGTLMMSFKLSIGKVIYAGTDLQTNEAIAAFANLDKSLLKEFLYYVLLGYDWQPLTEGKSKVKGNTLNKAILSGLMIPLPSLPEQKAIVEKLDAAFAEIDKLEENLISRKAQIQFLQMGIIDQLISESDPNSRDLSFGDLGQFVRGPFGGSLKKSIFVQRGYAVFEQQHAINNQFDSFRYFITKEKFEEMIRFAVQPGDLIMSCSGTFGKIAIVPQGAPPGIINQALLKIKPCEIIHLDFLLYWMRSSLFQRQLADGVGGAALQNVPSTAEMKKIRINLPPLQAQSLIEDRLRAALSDVDKLQRKNSEFVIALKSLRQSILSSAFTEESNVA